MSLSVLTSLVALPILPGRREDLVYAQAGDPATSDPAPPAAIDLGEFRLLGRVPVADLTAALERQWQAEGPPQGSGAAGQVGPGPGRPGRWLQRDAVGAVYRARQFRPLFLGGEPTHRVAENLVSQVALSSSHGLNPSRYHLEALEAVLKGLPAVREPPRDWWSRLVKKHPDAPPAGLADSLALVDALLVDRYLQLGYDLRFGELDGPPRPAAKLESKRPSALAGDSAAASVATAPVVGDTLITRLGADTAPPVNAWAPRHPQYALLRQALEDYRRVVKAGGWPKVDAVTTTIRPGQTDRRVAQARARLAAERAALTGQPAPAPPLQPEHFDTTLAADIRHFQSHHQLDPDGTLGKLTAAELAVTAERRLRQIEVTLSRWRMGPQVDPDPRVEVNAPSMTLNFWKGGKPVVTLRTVVGSGKESGAWLGKTAKAQTPELYDEIETIEINPFWYIPEIIVRTELIQKEKRKPGWLDKGGYEWYDPATGKSGGKASEIPEEDWKDPAKKLRLRQKAGAGNSLGRIKFIFHNAYGVYLHDTPEKQYFKKSRRNFSHGCVRLETPAVLAESLLVLTTSKRPDKPVEELMKGSAHKVYYLKPPMPIHLIYRTAWVDPDGTVNFLPDLYKWDEELATRLWPERLPLARGSESGEGRPARLRTATETPPGAGN